MSRAHVDHKHLNSFAIDKVNLPQDKAREFREQVKRLREKLEGYLSDHPEFSLQRMLLSGSLAKGTALRSLNDIDVAMYVSGSDAPQEISALLLYLAERLRKAFPNFSSDQVEPQTYSVKVSFRGSGLDVDVVPIIYHGDPDWRGDLVNQENGEYLETSIPLHLAFIRKRKSQQQTHFAQIVRLIKFWARNLKRENAAFRFKSFMIELILAHLCDRGEDFSDYIEGLQAFFTYVAKTGLAEKVVFGDYYDPATVGVFYEPSQIIDPLNAKNNVANLYTRNDLALIASTALDAGDAIDAANRAISKEKTVYYWQKVFGTPFQV